MLSALLFAIPAVIAQALTPLTVTIRNPQATYCIGTLITFDITNPNNKGAADSSTVKFLYGSDFIGDSENIQILFGPSAKDNVFQARFLQTNTRSIGSSTGYIQSYVMGIVGDNGETISVPNETNGLAMSSNFTMIDCSATTTAPGSSGTSISASPVATLPVSSASTLAGSLILSSVLLSML